MEIAEGDGKAVKKFMNMSNNESITGQLGLSVESPHHVSLLSSCRLHFISPSREKKFCVGKLELELLEEGLDLISCSLKNTQFLLGYLLIFLLPEWKFFLLLTSFDRKISKF